MHTMQTPVQYKSMQKYPTTLVRRDFKYSYEIRKQDWDDVNGLLGIINDAVKK